MTKYKLFLGGGGSADQSRSLDAAFLGNVSSTFPLLYIPHAMERARFPSCLAWLTSTLAPHGLTHVRMVENLQGIGKAEISRCSGLYIGGGDTGKLLREIKLARFQKQLLTALSLGKPIYGGSAGAIIFGADIRTAPEAKSRSGTARLGLNLLNGYSVVCHFKTKDHARVRRQVDALGLSVVALAEDSGLGLAETSVTSIGTGPVFIFLPGKKAVHIEPKETFVLEQQT